MATERLSMRSIREVLRQTLVLRRSQRKVARSLGISNGAVGSLMVRWKKLQLSWEAIEALSDEALECRFYGPRLPQGASRPPPDPRELHLELRRPGVTLELLHLEYLEKHPDGYRYSRFCELYSEWLTKQRLSMRQVHRGGEKLFIDYSGKKLSVVEALTGEVREAELYVAVLGASSYLYAEATWTQQLPDFIGSTVRTLEYMAGVPGALVPDCLKSAVTRACRYESDINRTYEELAQHYGTVVVPARPRKPKDKAKVEVSVQVAQRWILARLRNRTFHSLHALNEAVWELLEVVNDRLMRSYGKSRRQLYEELDKPALKPLPSTRYVVSEWRQVKPNIDYHVDVLGHFYSVPYGLRHEVLEARITALTVELFLKGKRVAGHVRSSHKGGFTTVPEHMPKSHRAHAEWTPSRFLQWASEVGPMTATLIEAILRERPHPELGYRSCLGILRLSKVYGAVRLEKACARAVRVGARSYRHVDALLKRGLEAAPLRTDEETASPAPLSHENLRGPDYYH